jgi:hypothetical protein
VLVAHHIPKAGASFVTKLAPFACEKSRAKKQPGGGEHAVEYWRGEAEIRKKIRVAMYLRRIRIVAMQPVHSAQKFGVGL